MNTYKRHRFPSDIISYAVWLYYRFNLSHRDIEDLLAERGITVSYETNRLRCIKFGTKYAKRLKQRQRPSLLPALQGTCRYAQAAGKHRARDVHTFARIADEVRIHFERG